MLGLFNDGDGEVKMVKEGGSGCPIGQPKSLKQ